MGAGVVTWPRVLRPPSAFSVLQWPVALPRGSASFVGKPQLGAEPAEPFPAFLVAGHGAVDDPPELRAVVGAFQMRQFVDEDVVDEGGRELHGRPVDVEVAAGRAGPPAVAERHDLPP